MKRHRIRDGALAEASGRSPRQIAYLRTGEKVPTLPTIVAIRRGCEQLSGKTVDVADLFDFEKAS